MSDGTSIWDQWEAIRRGPEVDPLRVLRATASYRRYFEAVESAAIQLARASGKTWDEIGSALGQSRQAVWQRVHRHQALAANAPPGGKAARAAVRAKLEAMKADPQDWYRGTRPIVGP